MTTREQLSIGDRVENPYGARGQITSIKDRVVVATYRDRGGSWTETYDEHWFACYAALLKKLEVRA